MTAESEFAHLQNLDEVGIRRYLGDRMRRERKKLRLSQEAFAASAGIALRTYKRFENHGEGSLETFVRAFMQLGHARNLYFLFPQPLPPKRLSLAERIGDIARRSQEAFEAGYDLARNGPEANEASLSYKEKILRRLGDTDRP